MTNICDIAFLMQFAAAFAGVIAAIIWWRASRARKPSDDIQAQLKAASGDLVHVLDRLMQDVLGGMAIRNSNRRPISFRATGQAKIRKKHNDTRRLESLSINLSRPSIAIALHN